jgi:hypothetical protein
MPIEFHNLSPELRAFVLIAGIGYSILAIAVVGIMDMCHSAMEELVDALQERGSLLKRVTELEETVKGVVEPEERPSC